MTLQLIHHCSKQKALDIQNAFFTFFLFFIYYIEYCVCIYSMMYPTSPASRAPLLSKNETAKSTWGSQTVTLDDTFYYISFITVDMSQAVGSILLTSFCCKHSPEHQMCIKNSLQKIHFLSLSNSTTVTSCLGTLMRLQNEMNYEHILQKELMGLGLSAVLKDGPKHFQSSSFFMGFVDDLLTDGSFLSITGLYPHAHP